MANITAKKLGGTADYQTKSPIRGVLDIKDLVDNHSLASGDTVELLTLEAGTRLKAVDAEIVEALSLGSSPAIDFGTTLADPDEYIDAQPTTAVGRFAAYVAGNSELDDILAADTTFYFKITGGTVASGKIAFSIESEPPAKSAKGLATKHVYANE